MGEWKFSFWWSDNLVDRPGLICGTCYYKLSNSVKKIIWMRERFSEAAFIIILMIKSAE